MSILFPAVTSNNSFSLFFFWSRKFELLPGSFVFSSKTVLPSKSKFNLLVFCTYIYIQYIHTHIHVCRQTDKTYKHLHTYKQLNKMKGKRKNGVKKGRSRIDLLPLLLFNLCLLCILNYIFERISSLQSGSVRCGMDSVTLFILLVKTFKSYYSVAALKRKKRQKQNVSLFSSIQKAEQPIGPLLGLCSYRPTLTLSCTYRLCVAHSIYQICFNNYFHFF